MKSKGHLINEKGKPVKASWLIKGMLKGVYFVTAHDPKNAKSNTPFRVRVGKGEGKEGIYGRITAHQSSNFDKLYFTVLTPINCEQAYKEHSTPIELEKYIHKMFREDENIISKDSWYEFKDLQHFLMIIEERWHTSLIVLQEEQEGLGNMSELMNEYKYTNTQVSFNLFTDMDKWGSRNKIPSSFEWFCTTPDKKKPIRGIVFKEGLVYEEYFHDWKDPEGFKEYKEVVGGHFYMKTTDMLLDSYLCEALQEPTKWEECKVWTKPEAEWEEIVIIGKEQDEITPDTPFMELMRSKHYYDQATPVGDTLIVLGSTVIPDHGGVECSLKSDITYYNYMMDFPCYNLDIRSASSKKSIRKFQYKPHDENLTPEGRDFHILLQKRMKEQQKRWEESRNSS